MTTYTHKPTPVDAVKYTAPDSTGELGNLDEVSAFIGSEVVKQDPWAPEVGQNCIRVPVLSETSAEFLIEGQRLELVVPGSYVQKHDDGLTVVSGAEFEDAYDIPAEPIGAHATDETAAPADPAVAPTEPEAPTA